MQCMEVSENVSASNRTNKLIPFKDGQKPLVALDDNPPDVVERGMRCCRIKVARHIVTNSKLFQSVEFGLLNDHPGYATDEVPVVHNRENVYVHNCHDCFCRFDGLISLYGPDRKGHQISGILLWADFGTEQLDQLFLDLNHCQILNGG